MGWEVSPEWKGETCFIIAGGPSVADQNLELLRGHKVIVVNSSVHRLPWADYLFFGDWRWWKEKENFVAVMAFKGVAVTTSEHVRSSRVKVMDKMRPPGLATKRDRLMMKRTSLSAAINLAFHLGAKRIVLLGADGKKAKDGRSHHHAPHKWPPRHGCWIRQAEELRTLVGPLRKAGVEVLNASPGSAWADLWPVVRLEEAL